jgi:hypothetical protein
LKKSKKNIKKPRILRWLQDCCNSCKKIHAQEVIDKNVMGKCTFSTFIQVHQIGFLITCCVCIFCNFFNRSEISIKFYKILRFLISYLIFSKIIFWGLSTLSHFLQTLKPNPHRMAQKTEKTTFLNAVGIKFACNIHICIVLLHFLKKKFKITALFCIRQKKPFECFISN